MNLLKAASIYLKRAQEAVIVLTPNEQTLLKNHVIKLTQQARKLVLEVESAIQLNIISIDARNHVMSLRNLAVRLSGMILGNQPQSIAEVEQIRDLYNQVAGEYSTLRNDYIQWEQPDLNKELNPEMKEIQDSLVYINRFLDKMENLTAKLPNIG